MPTDKGLEDFLGQEIYCYLGTEYDIEDIKKCLMNLLITIVQKNLSHLLNSYKLTDNQPNQESRQNVENH